MSYNHTDPHNNGYFLDHLQSEESSVPRAGSYPSQNVNRQDLGTVKGTCIRITRCMLDTYCILKGKKKSVQNGLIANWVARLPATILHPGFKIPMHAEFVGHFANLWIASHITKGLKPCKCSEIFARYACWIWMALVAMLLSGSDIRLDDPQSPFWIWVHDIDLDAIIRIYDSSDPEVLITIVIWLFDHNKEWIFRSGRLLPLLIVDLLERILMTDIGDNLNAVEDKYRHQTVVDDFRKVINVSAITQVTTADPKWQMDSPCAMLGALMAADMFPCHPFPNEVKVQVAASRILPAIVAHEHRPDSSSSIPLWVSN
ncbi:hypothetical protein DFS34DRAFT_590384 [Phlyctochytrium arcticum]|nr:hypothetical protein DFS34DRAFT_590384 [Phlyctochytrium arcticum]